MLRSCHVRRHACFPPHAGGTSICSWRILHMKANATLKLNVRRDMCLVDDYLFVFIFPPPIWQPPGVLLIFRSLQYAIPPREAHPPLRADGTRAQAVTKRGCGDRRKPCTPRWKALLWLRRSGRARGRRVRGRSLPGRCRLPPDEPCGRRVSPLSRARRRKTLFAVDGPHQPPCCMA